MEAAACAKPATGYTYARREPEKTALFQVLQQHLLTFEQEWTDKSDGRTLPSFVTDELHDFLGCGILARGFAQFLCKTCHERYVVAWSCKGRGFCPSCGGRRMNAGALTLVDHVLPEVPIRQFVLTLPFPLRFPLAFDGKLLGQVLRIFIDTVASNYRKRLADWGIPDGECGAVTVIQRANSDLRLSPHFHVLQLDGAYAPGPDGGAPIFHPAPELTQEDILAIVARASKRILRFLQRRGVITLVTAPGDGEITVVTDETIGEKDPLLARLLAAATAGASPAGPAHKRAPVRIVLDPGATPVAKGKLCGQQAGFNLHAQTKVAANDKKGRENLCKYILRPPLANDRLRDPRRQNRQARLQEALDGWHLVGRPCAARPHCQASRDHPSSSSPCRQIFGGYLLAQLSPQPGRPRPRRGGTRGKGQAFTAALALYFLEPAPQKDIRDRHRLPSLQEPAASHRHDRDRGHHQEDSQSHGTAYRGAQTPACTTAALAIWWRGRRLAELTARRPGRVGVDCPACSRKTPPGPRNPVTCAAQT